MVRRSGAERDTESTQEQWSRRHHAVQPPVKLPRQAYSVGNVIVDDCDDCDEEQICTIVEIAEKYIRALCKWCMT